MNTQTPPPNLVVIYQTGKACEEWVIRPLAAANYRFGRHYILGDDSERLRQSITHDTRLLVVGVSRDGSTGSVEGLIQYARSINPAIRVVGYSACPMSGIDIDKLIPKDTEEMSIRQFPGEVAHVHDQWRNPPQ